MHDVAAGRAAGMRTIAAAWGPFPRVDLDAAGPDHVADTPHDVVVLVTAWLVNVAAVWPMWSRNLSSGEPRRAGSKGRSMRLRSTFGILAVAAFVMLGSPAS